MRSPSEMDIIQKRCRSCKETKEISLFDHAPPSASKDGFAAHCKDCLSIRREAKNRGLRFCSACRLLKEKEEFYRNGARYNTRCKPCDQIHGKKRYYAVPAEERLKRWRKRWLREYGLTEEDYEQMLEAQGGGCGVCRAIVERLCVDHDHVTGQVRGLLCRTCNSGLGQLGDTIERLQAAISYLERSKA